jgi:hypothetical protein
MTEDEFFQAAGFKDAAEGHRLIASVDLSDRKSFEAFIVWKHQDGSKEGLLKIIGQEKP